MKITFNLEEKNIKKFMSALSIGIFHLGQDTQSIYFGLGDELPYKLNKTLKENNLNSSEEKLKYMQERFDVLKDIYNQILTDYSEYL